MRLWEHTWWINQLIDVKPSDEEREMSVRAGALWFAMCFPSFIFGYWLISQFGFSERVAAAASSFSVWPVSFFAAGPLCFRFWPELMREAERKRMTRLAQPSPPFRLVSAMTWVAIAILVGFPILKYVLHRYG